MNTLLIEDDKNFAKMTTLRLRSWNKQIKIAHAENIATAKKYLEKYPEGTFELVVMDQHLPDGLGRTLLSHPKIKSSVVLAVSSDSSPDIPAGAVEAGACHFLSKSQISEPLFFPLLNALITRKRLEKELVNSRIEKSNMETIATLLATLRHEINNPLGAVFGGLYLLGQNKNLTPKERETLELLKESSKRIQHVVEKLCEATNLEKVTKGKEDVFHVPGDKDWD